MTPPHFSLDGVEQDAAQGQESGMRSPPRLQVLHWGQSPFPAPQTNFLPLLSSPALCRGRGASESRFH